MRQIVHTQESGLQDKPVVLNYIMDFYKGIPGEEKRKENQLL